MTTYRFAVLDDMNEWFLAVEVDATDAHQARARAEHMLFARRTVGAGVALHLDEEDDGGR